MDQLDGKLKDLSNRMELFRHLTSDDFNSDINEAIFRGLLADHYEKFVEACDYVKHNKEKIASVSCFMENGDVHFVYDLKNET